MRDIKMYLSVAHVLTIWFWSLVGLLIEMNHFLPKPVSF